MGKMTPARRTFLTSISDGLVVLSSDDGSFVEKTGERVDPRVLRAAIEAGWVDSQSDTNIPGWNYASHQITDAGRAALASN